MIYLISGIPACRKTSFGDWVQELGWLHIDLEAWDGSAQHRLWEKCLKESSVSHFITLLNNSAPNIVFTWGFPPDHCIGIVRQFKDHGVHVWWFDGDLGAARAAKGGRDNEVNTFDIQMSKIQAHQAELDALYGGNTIRTLQETGDCLPYDKIAEAIGLRLNP
jgi:hypothetical protein